MLMIEITQDDHHPAATSAARNDLPSCLLACGIPQALVLTALQRLPTITTLRFCKPSPEAEWEIQDSA